MNKKKFAGSCVPAIIFVATLEGCSVGMAISGQKDPDLAVLQKGCERATVESQLGPATSMSPNPDGSYSCTYDYEVGDEPSAGRAALHAGMDVLTLGIWEVFGTPLELMQGTKYRAVATYGDDNKLQSLSINRE